MKKTYIFLILILCSCKNESSEKSRFALLVSQHSEMKYEEYFNGCDKDKLVNIQSITKSIVSILIGRAIDEGIIEHEHVSIGHFFPEIDENKKDITITHLLNHTSGLEWKGYLEHEDYLKSKDPVHYVLSKDLAEDPGTVYNYNSGGIHLLSAILTQVSGQSTFDFAQEKLFTPLGIKQVDWKTLGDGIYGGAGFSLNMLPKDLIKIGSLFIKGSQENSTNVVSDSWLNKMRNDKLKKETRWGLRHSKHGYGWYSATSDSQDILYSMGYGGQFILIIPVKELVIVTNHNHDTPDGIDQQLDFLVGTFPELLEMY